MYDSGTGEGRGRMRVEHYEVYLMLQYVWRGEERGKVRGGEEVDEEPRGKGMRLKRKRQRQRMMRNTFKRR